MSRLSTIQTHILGTADPRYLKVEVHLKLMISQSKFSGPCSITYPDLKCVEKQIVFLN